MKNTEIAGRVQALLAQMTLEEKVAQMVQVPYAMVGREEAMNSRLGIPVIFGIDAIHGHGLNDHATIFPTQLAAACSWDTDVVYTMGRVTARA